MQQRLERAQNSESVQKGKKMRLKGVKNKSRDLLT